MEEKRRPIRKGKMPTLERNVDQIARVMMPNRASRNQFEIQKAHTDKRAICPNDSPGKYNGITVPHLKKKMNAIKKKLVAPKTK